MSFILQRNLIACKSFKRFILLNILKLDCYFVVVVVNVVEVDVVDGVIEVNVDVDVVKVDVELPKRKHLLFL